MAAGLKNFLIHIWKRICELSGDDAYERYLAHHTSCHAGAAPLSRGEYFRRQEEMK